jgi:hypothetical protein
LGFDAGRQRGTCYNKKHSQHRYYGHETAHKTHTDLQQLCYLTFVNQSALLSPQAIALSLQQVSFDVAKRLKRR